MSFIRVFIGRTSNTVRHVIEQDVPFPGEGPMLKASDEELDAVDLGFVDQHDWRDLEGRACSPAQHFFLRLERDHEDLPKIHDCPCSIEGIKARLRAQGPEGVPIKARAWLANILPADQVAALGIGRGIPLSAIKAAEALRNRKDPGSGSKLPYLERIGVRHQEQRQRASARARARVAAVNAAAGEAWDEMARAIARKGEG